jgi:hypothetical protein
MPACKHASGFIEYRGTPPAASPCRKDFAKEPPTFPSEMAFRPNYRHPLEGRLRPALSVAPGLNQNNSIKDGANDHPASWLSVSAPRRNKTMARLQPPLAVPTAYIDPPVFLAGRSTTESWPCHLLTSRLIEMIWQLRLLRRSPKRP